METSYQPLDLSCRRSSSIVTQEFSNTNLPPYSTGSGPESMETSPDLSSYSGFLPHQYQYAYPPLMKDSITSHTDRSYNAMQQNQQMFNLAPYMIQAAALQQRLQLMNAWQAGNVSSGMGSLNQQMTNSFPSQMFTGRDGTLSGPDYPTNHSGVASHSLVNTESADKLETLRMEMRGGQPTVSPEKMRRPSTTDSASSSDIGTTTNNNNIFHSPGIVKDNKYYEKRRKNNIAAKMSRDRRRDKGDEIAIRAILLERKNHELHAELNLTRKQVSENDTEITALRMELSRRGAGIWL